MPEERNRIIVDHMADLRLAPTADAVDALAAEGVTRGVRRVGDVRADAVALSQTIDSESKGEATGPDLPDSYALATVHRQATTDDESTLRDVIDGLERASLPVVLPIHPRTADRLGESGMIDWAEDRVRIVEPLGHTAFLRSAGRCRRRRNRLGRRPARGLVPRNAVRHASRDDGVERNGR